MSIKVELKCDGKNEKKQYLMSEMQVGDWAVVSGSNGQTGYQPEFFGWPVSCRRVYEDDNSITLFHILTPDGHEKEIRSAGSYLVRELKSHEYIKIRKI